MTTPSPWSSSEAGGHCRRLRGAANTTQHLAAAVVAAASPQLQFLTLGLTNYYLAPRDLRAESLSD